MAGDIAGPVERWFIPPGRVKLTCIVPRRAIAMAISEGDRHDAYLRRGQRPVLDVEGILTMLRRRAAFIAGVTLACAALSLAYILLAPPRYNALGRIQLAQLGSQLPQTDAASPKAGDAEIGNEIRALTSRTILDKVIANERLEADPLFGARPAGIFRALLVSIGLVPVTDTHAIALRRLERAVSVKQQIGSQAVDINVVTSDRETSARVANALMDSYLEETSNKRSDVTPRAVASADVALEILQACLRDAEQNYQKYRQDNSIATGQPLIAKQVDELSSQVTAAEARVTNLRSTLTQIQRARDDRDFGAIPEALRNRTIETLRNRYTVARRIEADLSETLGPRHPDLKFAKLQTAEARRMLDQAVGDMARSTAAELDRARAAVTRLKARLEASRKELTMSSETLARLRELEREVETNRAAYQAFLLKSRDISERPQLDNSLPRILSYATPPLERAGPSTVRVLLISVLLGLGLAVSLAWLLELMDSQRERPRVAK